MFIRETPMLKKVPSDVFVLNPKQVKKFHDCNSDVLNTDFTDTFVIADNLRFGRIGMKRSVVEDKYLEPYRA